MAVMNEALLDEKLAILERVREWSPRLLAKFEALLGSEDDYTVLRMNPLTFARERGVPPNEALDLFLHATKLGLLTLDWHLLCPMCGAAVESFASLRGVHSKFFCALCHLHSYANLDDYIQVSFTVAPGLRRIRFHDIDALSAEDFVYRLRYTREAHIHTLDGPRMVDMLPQMMGLVRWLAPGERHQFVMQAPEPGVISFAEFQAHTGTVVEARSEATSERLAIQIGETSLTSSDPHARVGAVTVDVSNQRSQRLVFAAAYHSNRDMAMATEGPVTVLEPIVTGAMLLTNQTFRRLFRSETLDGTEGLSLREVTVLFTDLKSSTALYERIGDLKAFTLVHRHFERLGEVVAQHSGAIVKTIGDAVMAAFQRPLDAVRAAFEMQAQIDAFNREHGSRDVILKIGVHRGPSIAVTLNERLDFFGHTVNVAARVQGLADADEIYVTDEVYRGDGVASLVGQVETKDAQLRGIERQVRVHKIVRAAQA